MAVSTKMKTGMNSVLKHVGLKIDSLTVDRQESARLENLRVAGNFNRPVYTLLEGMKTANIEPIIEGWNNYQRDLERLIHPGSNDVEYNVSNPYFSSPDSDVLYIMIRSLKPRKIVEIGCGNSTRVVRQAIIDGGLRTQLIAIDPSPRSDVSGLADRVVKQRLEAVRNGEMFEELQPGDVLFVDSSHEVRVGNDVACLFCDIIPNLSAGIVLHFHDIFLPYEYPHSFTTECPSWGEQYLLHTFLQGQAHEVLWPGYWIQRSRPELANTLPFLAQGRAQSFWFRLC